MNFDRIFHTLVVAVFLFLFAAAVVVRPNASGYGTHTQLSLPPCAFYKLTGLPCISCGLTTSIAYLVRGDIVRSFKSHPVGPVFAMLIVITAIYSLVSLFMGYPWYYLFRKLWFQLAAISAICFLIFFWFFRLLIGKNYWGLV